MIKEWILIALFAVSEPSQQDITDKVTVQECMEKKEQMQRIHTEHLVTFRCIKVKL